MPERGSVITGRLWIMRASKYLREIKLAACLTACLPGVKERRRRVLRQRLMGKYVGRSGWSQGMNKESMKD